MSAVVVVLAEERQRAPLVCQTAGIIALGGSLSHPRARINLLRLPDCRTAHCFAEPRHFAP